MGSTAAVQPSHHCTVIAPVVPSACSQGGLLVALWHGWGNGGITELTGDPQSSRRAASPRNHTHTRSDDAAKAAGRSQAHIFWGAAVGFFPFLPKSVAFMMLSNLFSLGDLPRVTILLLRRVPLSRLGLMKLSSVPVTHLNLPLFIGTRKAVFLPLEAG